MGQGQAHVARQRELGPTLELFDAYTLLAYLVA